MSRIYKYSLGDRVEFVFNGHVLFSGKISDIRKENDLEPYVIKTDDGDEKPANEKYLFPARTETDELADRIMNLLAEVKEVSAFSHESSIFLGNRATAVRDYVHANPSDSFRVWIVKHYEQLR